MLDPIFFGTTGLNRFDDPRGEYGVLYAAEDEHGAFIETFGRSPGRNVVSEDGLRSRPLVELEAARPLRLVDLTGSGLASIGATAEIATGDYRRAQGWSRALHEHPEAPDGLRYRLRHDPDRIGVAIFERAGSQIRSHGVGTLLTLEHRKLLAAILNEYGYGLISGPSRH